MLDYFPIVIGFFGSLHCMGMCGPLVLAYTLRMKGGPSPGTPERSPLNPLSILHHLLFNGGRLVTYGVLGFTAAAFFRAADLNRFFFDFRIPMTLVGGLLLILIALVLLRWIPLPSFFTAVPMNSWFGRLIHQLFQSRKALHKFFLGLAVGALPCCLSWAMIITAASTRDPAKGFLTMVLFGLGTVPALLLVGLSSTFLSRRVRFLGERVAALAIMGTGVVYALKGVGILE